MHALAKRWITPTLCALGLSFTSSPAALSGEMQRAATQPGSASDPDEAPPSYLQGVSVEEHLGAALPLDLSFVDSSRQPVRLGDSFDGRLPVILTFNYSNCPMLCGLELSGLVSGLRKLGLRLGESYRAVTVSLDPRETPQAAAASQAHYLEQYGDPAAKSSWRFLTGQQREIAALTTAAGFQYRYDPKSAQYYHAAALMIASPGGKIMRYLYGIEFAPRTLQLGLTEASRGKIGTTLDRLILYCCAYDPREGSYSLVASRLIQLGGASTLLVLAAFLLGHWGREQRKRKRSALPRSGAATGPPA